MLEVFSWADFLVFKLYQGLQASGDGGFTEEEAVYDQPGEVAGERY